MIICLYGVDLPVTFMADIATLEQTVILNMTIKIAARTPHRLVFIARCYASAVLAMGLCPSVCVCVCHKPAFY